MAEVGRSANVDLSVPQDAAMADVHFVLETDAATCRLRDVSGAGVALNGEAAAAAILAHGDRLTAGSTAFHVEITGSQTAAAASAEGAEATADAAPAAARLAKVEADLAHEGAEKVSLDEEAEALLRETYTPRQYVEVLVENDQFRDAIRFLAHAMPKREAVWWAHQAVTKTMQDRLTEADQQALDVALEWIKTPDEDHRQPAMAAAERTNCETAAGLTAMAAFFSGGSLAPPDYEPVPPGELLTAQTVGNSVILAGIGETSSETDKNYPALVELGLSVANGESELPEP